MDLFDGCKGRTLAGGLEWLAEPADWRFTEEGLHVTPRAQTDFFRPRGRPGRDNAAMLFVRVGGDFTAIAHARAELAAFGDAAAVTLRVGEALWAKLCIERSPAGEVSVVSVVTRDWSDDANGEILREPECRLRITRQGTTVGMHYSLDGARWRFVRAFSLDLPDTVAVGIHAQAPFQAGCRALFRAFTVTEGAVGDFRSGE